jgi:hypothetical protein
MPKSKIAEGIDAQELAALKLDMEHVNTRTEEIGLKVDGVEEKISALTEQVSQLTAFLKTDQGRPPEREKSPQHREPAGENRGHSRPPHWRRRPEATDLPRYDYHCQDTEHENNGPQPEEQAHQPNYHYIPEPQYFPPYPPQYYPPPPQTEPFQHWHQYPPHHSHTQFPPQFIPETYYPPNPQFYHHAQNPLPAPPPIPQHQEPTHQAEPPDRGHQHRGHRHQELDRDAQFYRSIAKAPKMDFPRFDGSNPQEWLRTTKKYFDMVYVPEDAKFDYA